MEPQPRSSLDLSAIVIPSPDVLVQEIDGEAVLLTLDSECYFDLDTVGTRVWQHLLMHRRLDRVCDEMQKEYDVDESRLRTDVLQLVEDLIEAGIATVERNVTNDAGDS